MIFNTYPTSRKACIFGSIISMSLSQSGMMLNNPRYFSRRFRASNWLNLATLRNRSKNSVSGENMKKFKHKFHEHKNGFSFYFS